MNKINLWSHLSNAHHIDWVIQSVKITPHIWIEAYNAINGVACDAAWYVARDAALGVIRDAALGVIRDAALNAALDAIWSAAYGETRVAAIISILALIAYDDCDQYLSMTYEQLKVYAALSDKPQALLLLPMKWAQEHERLVTSV